MLHLALLKLGFDGKEAEAMPEGTAMAYLQANRELVNPPKKKRYKVLRKKKHG